MVGIGRAFSSYIVVQHASLGRLVDMGLAQVHAVAGNGTSDSADEGDRSVWLDPLDDADMCQWVVEQTVPVEVPGVVKKYQITRAYVRVMMENAMLAYMVVDQPDAVRIRLGMGTLVEVDTVLQKDGPGYSCAVVVDAPTLDGDSF
jgi:hypothetical protein